MRKRNASVPALKHLVLAGAETLFPGYFALVMATGVVSIACHLRGVPAVPEVLLGINWASYAILWLLTILRLFVYGRRFREDLFDHPRAPGFFTLVAGTCMLGTQTAIVAGAGGLAASLWYLGLGLWFAVMYAFFTAVTVRERKPSIAVGINGAWLIAAVATHSVVVLRCALEPDSAPPPEIQLLCLTMFMVGSMLYLAIIPLIFYRMTFIRFAVYDFAPPYWINMGAVAITTLAGSALLIRAEYWPLLADYVPFLKGFTIFFWAIATRWRPFRLALTGWRYLLREDTFTYEPQIWGMIFPLGMYTTATYQISRALDFPFLEPVADLLVFVALLAWLVAFCGLLAHIGHAVHANLAGRQRGWVVNRAD